MTTQAEVKRGCHQTLNYHELLYGKLISLSPTLESADEALNPDFHCLNVGTNLGVSAPSFLSPATFVRVGRSTLHLPGS